jgi:hypothetical protein
LKEDDMRLKLALASSVVAATIVAASGAGAAGAASPAFSPAASASNAVQRVEYDWREHRRLHHGYWYGAYRYDHGGYCGRERHECAERWGWGGWGFRRCVERHGC